jgi:hypothetical protein
MSQERRRSPRIELLGQLHGRVVTYDKSVSVRNVSLGGLSLESAFAFTVGVVHAFRLTLGDGSSVELRGTVLRCREEPTLDGSTRYITGVQFVDDATEGDEGIGPLIGRL